MSEHYFSDLPGTPEVRSRITVRLFGREVPFVSANGVFSGDGLDLGTSVLLREAPLPRGPVRVLDLGAGWGPIALGLALSCPQARVDAVEVNERALALCRDNVTAHGVGDRVRVLRPEQVVPDRSYDQIWSNPPIRIGKSALHDLLLNWLPRLTPTGTAYLVVGRNLGADSLQRWLGDQGWRCDRLASAKGFRVLEVGRPRSTTA